MLRKNYKAIPIFVHMFISVPVLYGNDLVQKLFGWDTQKHVPVYKYDTQTHVPVYKYAVYIQYAAHECVANLFNITILINTSLKFLDIG